MEQVEPLLIGTVGRRFGCPPWQIRRLFERGLLPPAARVGAHRIIAARDLDKVERYLPPKAEEAAHRA